MTDTAEASVYGWISNIQWGLWVKNRCTSNTWKNGLPVFKAFIITAKVILLLPQMPWKCGFKAATGNPGHCTPCFTCIPAPTHVIQWMNYLLTFCRSQLITHSFQSGKSSGRCRVFLDKGPSRSHNIHIGTKCLFNILAQKSTVLVRCVHLTSHTCNVM